MFDIAWSEMALIAAVALIVIGPKDLPRVLRQVGIWVRKLRMLAGEFQKNVDDMVREAELDDVKRDVERIGRVDLNREVVKAVDPTGDVERSLRIDDDNGPKLATIPTASEPLPAEPPPPPARPDDTPQTRPDDKVERP